MTMTNDRGLSRNAFTLLEVLVVLTLLALGVGLASVSLQEPIAAARLGNTVERMAHYDGLIRRWSTRFGKVGELTLDIDSGTIAFEPSEDASESNLGALTLLRGVRIKQLAIADDGNENSGTTIHYSPWGTTPTYAICISSASAERWLLFAGLTGQVTVFEKESDVQSVLQIAAQ